MEHKLVERDQNIENLHKELQNLGDRIIEIGKAHDREQSALKDVSSLISFKYVIETV